MNARQKKKKIKIQLVNAKPEQVIVLKFPWNDMDLDEIQLFFEHFRRVVPNKKCVALPKNIDLVSENKSLLIKQLENLIEYLKAEDE
jgi:hypothetical protein